MKRLDKLDLGENFITSIPPGMFNKTLSVNDLNLVTFLILKKMDGVIS